MHNLLSIEDRIMAAIRRIIRAVDLHSRQLFEKHGLTGPQLAALREAARHGNVTVAPLARALHISQPTLTGILDRLERRGLVTRTRDGVDRRTVRISVTHAGHELLASTPHPLQERFRQELTRLHDWEQTQTLSTLQRIAEMMEAESLDASPLLTSGALDAPDDASAKADAGTMAPDEPMPDSPVEPGLDPTPAQEAPQL